KTELSKVFNRGFWDGYYLGKRLGEWSSVYGSIATHTKTYVGKITNYFTKISVIELKIEATDIEVGQTALIIGPTTGVYEFEIKEIRIDDQSVKKATQGQIVSIPVDELVRRGDKFYIFKPNETIKIY
ncbi:MAG TPA: U32 family peptidase, partial [Salinivirgaceae bacterium]|nr:U32 family peptidase [Salinivirgaceae bacterium]